MNSANEELAGANEELAATNEERDEELESSLPARCVGKSTRPKGVYRPDHARPHRNRQRRPRIGGNPYT